MGSRSRVVALIIVLVSSVPAPAAVAAPDELPPGGNFVDDDGISHEGSIEAIREAGITNGCGGTRFCPNDYVTRGQMAAFLDRALDLPDATTPSGFTDTTGTFFDNIERLRAAGITNGCSATTFCPGTYVTRGQMAAFLDRALDLPDATTPSGFTDTAGTFFDNIERLRAAGITVGCGATSYCTGRFVTRAEMATFLMRGLGLDELVPEPRPLPEAGNPDGDAPVPVGGGLESTAFPDHVIGDGTPASCTSAGVVAAVAQGGVITFDCGPDPVTIEMLETARVFNDQDPDIVIDGGGLVTLSGMGQRRILYMNTCDQAQVWTTPHCQNQDHPRLTVQNLTFVDGNATGEGIDLGGGGGAIWVRGGRFKVVNSRFFDNVCAPTGPDVAGGAIRVFSQYEGLPVFITGSTFGSTGRGNTCSNGGALGSIGVSMTITNSSFEDNSATGWGANPQRAGTPGGGNGGAIANDGNTYVLTVTDTIIRGNVANEGGGGIFYVSNDRSGNLRITDSSMSDNPSLGFETAGYSGVFYLGSGPPIVTGSSLS
ncbi:MAG: S-layer homology domain-containing protein [Actinomycetota bacterium]